MNKFYSNGKLLISGEYLILEGAQALAMPVKHGQCLKIEESSSSKIIWQSYRVLISTQKLLDNKTLVQAIYL